MLSFLPWRYEASRISFQYLFVLENNITILAVDVDHLNQFAPLYMNSEYLHSEVNASNVDSRQK